MGGAARWAGWGISASLAACSIYDLPAGGTTASTSDTTGGGSPVDTSTITSGGDMTGAGGTDGSGGAAGTTGDVTTSASGGSSGGGTTGMGTGGSPARDAGDADASAAQDVGIAEADVYCAIEADATFCKRLQKDCGTFTSINNCGISYTTVCGACADTSTCGGGGTLNVCSGGGQVNRAQGGTITASVPTDPKATESRAKIFDNDVATKWYVTATTTPWIAYQFAAGQSYAITSYSVTSANDTPLRDPKSWRLEGTNDATLSTWMLLDTRTNETFANRFQTNVYSFANTTAYIAYRFFVTANAGAAQCQFAEIQLFDR
jgi:hypothetical protein